MSIFDNLEIPDIEWQLQAGNYYIFVKGYEGGLDMGFFMAICDHLDYHKVRG